MLLHAVVRGVAAATSATFTATATVPSATVSGSVLLPTPSVTSTIVQGPTATATDTDTALPLLPVSCAPHTCAGDGVFVTDAAVWNWVGAGGYCMTANGSCVDADCCTNGGGSNFAPDFVDYSDCQSVLDMWGSPLALAQPDCANRCAGDAACWGYYWSAGDGAMVGTCRLMHSQPLTDCTRPVAGGCDHCRYHAKALRPWYRPGSGECVGVGAVSIKSAPTGALVHGNVGGNVTPAACQWLCDEASGCRVAEWVRFEPPWFMETSTGNLQKTPEPGVRLVWGACRLWSDLNCSAAATPYCQGNGTCFFNKTGFAWDCTDDPADYLGRVGPILCLCLLGILGASSCVLGCASLRRGSQGRSNAVWCCKIFAISFVPLFCFGFLFAYIDGLREVMLDMCQGDYEPPWGPNLVAPAVSINLTSVDSEGSALLRWMNKTDLANMTCEESEEAGHFWELASCLSPSAWGEKWSHLPPAGTSMWEASFSPGMPQLGNYDFMLRCGYRPEPLLPSSQRIVTPKVASGEIRRVLQIVQFRTRDGTCAEPVWEVLLGEEECVATQLNMSGSVLVVSPVCSACEWLRWEGVKNAPYEMMVINSFCSLFFSGLMGLIIDTLIPFFGDQVARFVPCFRRNCGCLTSGGDVGDGEAAEFQFCPCAPNEVRRLEMVGPSQEWDDDAQGPPEKPCCSSADQKLTCSYLNCPGLFDLEEDWKSDEEEEEEEGEEEEVEEMEEEVSQDPTAKSHRAGSRGPPPSLITPQACSGSPGQQSPSPSAFTPGSSSPPPARPVHDREPIAEDGGDMTADASEAVTGTQDQSDSGGVDSPTRRQRGWSSPRTQDEYEVYVEEEEPDRDELPKPRWPVRRGGCCRCQDYVVYWTENTWRWIADNQDIITESIQEDLLKYDSALHFARSRAAPTFSFIVVKSVYFFVFVVVSMYSSVEDALLSQWDRYQIMYIRLVNSGSMLLLLESSIGVDAAFQLLRAGKGQGSASAREVRKAQFNILLTTAVVGLYLPVMFTHIVPMAIAYLWVLLLLYMVGFKVFMRWPADFANDFLASDWKNLVPTHPYRALIVAHGLGLWQKFTSSFLMVLPLQMLFNYGVLIYNSTPYWRIPSRELHSRSWECFFEPYVDEGTADMMQLASFFF